MTGLLESLLVSISATTVLVRAQSASPVIRSTVQVSTYVGTFAFHTYVILVLHQVLPLTDTTGQNIIIFPKTPTIDSQVQIAM